MRNTLPLDLQFFADDETESVNEPEIAETAGTEETVSDVSEDGEETETEGENEAEAADQQTPEQNHAYAQMRRKAEYDAQMKYQNQQAKLDAMYAEKFRGLSNPETGQPIRGAADYFEALAAQERLQTRQDMQQAGLDPSLLDRAIASSPLIKQAQAAIEQNNQIQSQRMIEEDMRTIIQFDPSVNSEQDIVSQSNFNEVVDYVQSHPGMRLADAYKLVNFDRLSSNRAKSAEQHAINQAKSKTHLAAPNGLANEDNSIDIPAAEINQWKEFFPDKSAKDLRALYNKTHGG